jgi:DNA-binding transcriptional LysR family regulator
MDLHQLKVFREAARAGGFTRASDKLHLSQSTVSLHIKRLEEELGTLLFQRSKKRVLLNSAGERLLPYVDRVFQELRNADAAVRELSQVEHGTIRLGSGATTVTYLLPKILGAFQKRYPSVELVVVTGSTEALLLGVEQQMLDMAVVMQPAKPAPTLEMVPVLREELVYVVSSSHPYASKDSLEPKDINEIPFISYLRGSAIQRLIDRHLNAMGVTPRVTMEMENVEVIKALVRAGLGTAILPLCCVAGSQGSMLHILRIRKYRLERDLSLALPKVSIVSPIVEKFAARLTRTFSGKNNY